MRKGPHPLPVHLGMVAANMSGIHKYASNFVSSLSNEDAIEMMRGIKMYMEYPFTSTALPLRTIWSNGSVSIESPASLEMRHRKSGFPLLLIPSLINKANILDISEKRSMLRWFNEHGIETYLLDWGDFTCDEEKDIDINTLVRSKLSSAIRKVSEVTGKPLDVLGYCMGGTLLLANGVFDRDYIRRMTLLASPWDFQVQASTLARNVRIWSPNVMPVVKKRGYLPSEWVQALFASLDPNGSAQKFIKFASMDQSSSEAILFVSVEDWLNDGVDLPGNIALHCIQEWFVGNKLASGEWYVAGEKVDIESIESDILILASKKDQLVPFECASNLQKQLCSASVRIIELDCGHVGLIVGRNAIETVWYPILEWLKKK